MKMLFKREELFVKYNLASNIHRSFSSFDINIPFSRIYNTLWTVSYDPKDPDAGGWGTCIHQTVFPLTGRNVEIVPKDSKGYLLDSTTNVLEWSKNAYSVTVLAETDVDKNDLVRVSINCFVSEEYNGESVYLSLEGRGSLIHNDYDLNLKNTWQTLSVEMDYNSKNYIQMILGFWKYKCTDFSSLKGYVIFANPHYEIIRRNSLSRNSNIIEKTNSIRESNMSLDINQKKNIYNTSLNISGFDSYPLTFLLNNSMIDRDPLRKWVSKLISEDTTYRGFKKSIIVDSIKNDFIDSRVVRWKFAWKLFTKQYNLTNKIWGGGFSFLNWYGYYFVGDKTVDDYPHNPFLSVLLYSGIIGLIFYLMLMYKVFYYYIKYFNEYKILSVFFFITFYFSFFSAGSPFDPPIMGFFVILPFFIHSIQKKKKPKLFDDHIS